MCGVLQCVYGVCVMYIWCVFLWYKCCEFLVYMWRVLLCDLCICNLCCICSMHYIVKSIDVGMLAFMWFLCVHLTCLVYVCDQYVEFLW